MRKYSPLVALLLAVFLIGCGGKSKPTASPTVVPTQVVDVANTPSPDSAVGTATSGSSEDPTVGPGTGSAEAVCVQSVADFPMLEGLPPVTADDHTKGPGDASLTIIEYSDFQCPACGGVQPLIAYLEQMYGDDLQVVFRHFPLSSIHPLAVVAAEAAEAAAAQGAFWEMHDQLFGSATEWSGLAEAQVIDVFVGYAEALGLDARRFRSDMEGQVYRPTVLESYDTAVAIGLRWTPTFIVNGRLVPSGVQLPAFVELTQSDPIQGYDGPPPQVVDLAKAYRASIETSKGVIVVELYPDRAPANVNSFAFLAQDGWYDGQAFFFVRPGVVAYSGDPTSLGFVLPFSGFACGDEIGPGTPFDEAGIVAMYAPAPDQNSGIFFITMDAIPDLNGQYTVIGKVVEGMDVVNGLAAAQPGDGSRPDRITSISIEES